MREIRTRQLIEIASTLTAGGRIAEAADLLTVVLALEPSHTEARRRLIELRARARRGTPTSERASLLGTAAEELRRDLLDAVQFVGMARQIWRKGDDERARELLAIARAKAPNQPETYKLAAAVAGEGGRWEEAAADLAEALRLDPFDGESAELLSHAEEKAGRLPAAAEAGVHAFLLLADLDAARKSDLSRRLTRLRRRLGWSREELAAAFERRRELLEATTDRLSWKQDLWLGETSRPPGRAFFGPPPGLARKGLLSVANRLAAARAFVELADDELVLLASTVQEEAHSRGSLVAPREQAQADLFLVEKGEVQLVRSSSYGPLVVRRLMPGDLLGEETFFGVGGLAGDAMAVRSSRLLRFDAAALRQVLSGHRPLEARLLWLLWHALAAKLRKSNEELARIFPAGGPGPHASGPTKAASSGERLEIDHEEALRTLAKSGLSKRELELVAPFATEQRFAAGEYVFRDGDAGERLYAVVTGKVVISKFIPGAGEEALGVLGPGEIFGEMALLDGRPRSADARADGGAAKLLVLDRAAIASLLARSSESALEVLRLLGRLLANRLAELDEKIVLWRILTSPEMHEAEHEQAAAGR